MDVDRITAAIVDSAMKVHSALGPGLLESVYETCLKHELSKRGFKVESQLWLPVIYDGVQVEGGYKVDLLVENAVIIELKVVEKIRSSQSAATFLSEIGRQTCWVTDQLQRRSSS